MSGVSSWLQRQKKGDLIDLADSIGFAEYEGLRKVDLDVALQDYLEENTARLSGDPRLAPFYSRRGPGSPIKRESSNTLLDNGDSTTFRKPAGRPSRRVAKPAEEASNAVSSASPSVDDSEEGGEDDSEPEVMAARTRSAVARTPARNSISILQSASGVPLPPSPAVVATNIEHQTSLIRQKLAATIQDSGIIETAEATRETLSTVTSVHFAVFAFESWALRNELLSNLDAFTIPAITSNILPNALHFSAQQIKLPNLFLLASSSFWYPTILWAISTFILPLIASYFFNLTLNNSARYRNGRVAARPVFDPVGYSLDPLTFNIVKALLVYAIFGKGWTFGGWVHEESVARINGALYGGWPSVLVGNGIGVLVTLYDAMLKK